MHALVLVGVLRELPAPLGGLKLQLEQRAVQIQERQRGGVFALEVRCDDLVTLSTAFKQPLPP